MQGVLKSSVPPCCEHIIKTAEVSTCKNASCSSTVRCSSTIFIFTAAAQTVSIEIVDKVCFNSQLSENLLSFIASASLPLWTRTGACFK